MGHRANTLDGSNRQPHGSLGTAPCVWVEGGTAYFRKTSTEWSTFPERTEVKGAYQGTLIAGGLLLAVSVRPPAQDPLGRGASRRPCKASCCPAKWHEGKMARMHNATSRTFPPSPTALQTLCLRPPAPFPFLDAHGLLFCL